VCVPGGCQATAGSSYFGESGRTHRLTPDGHETELAAGAEPLCAIIVLCDDSMLITRGEEERFIRFADLAHGRKIADIVLEGMPTWVALSPDRKHIFISTYDPGVIVRVDPAKRHIDKIMVRYAQTDPKFSGIARLIVQDNCVIGAFSSFFTIDGGAGEVFSVDLDLDDFRSLHHFHGAYAYIAPDSPTSVFFKIYNKEDLWRLALDGSGAHSFAAAPRGYHFLARLTNPSLVVATHWTTGEILAVCTATPEKRFHMNLGGIGSVMAVRGNRVFVPTAAGYATMVFPETLCD